MILLYSMKVIAAIYSESAAGFCIFFEKLMVIWNSYLVEMLGFLPTLGPLIAKTDKNTGKNGSYFHGLGSQG